MRRLPVYLLLDSSGSLRGEPIEPVRAGLRAMVDSLRQDPHALDSVHLSIITFDADVKVLVPLTPVEQFLVPDLVPPESGPTHLGRALKDVCRQVDREVQKSSASVKGDWRPILFIMTDGAASDKQAFEEAIEEVRRRKFGVVIACAAGAKARPDELRRLTDRVYTLETMDSTSFESLFRWVSSSIEVNSSSIGVTSEVILPPPPVDVNPVL